MRSTNKPAPPAELSADFAALFESQKRGWSANRVLSRAYDHNPGTDWSAAKQSALALAALAAYVRARHAPTLTGAAAQSWDSALIADVLGGTFNAAYFATATLQSDICTRYVPNEIAAGAPPAPCGVDPLRAPSLFQWLDLGATYAPPTTLSTATNGSPGWHGETISGRWQDTALVVRLRRYTTPFAPQPVTVAPLLYRFTSQWRIDSRITLDRKWSYLPGSRCTARFWIARGGSTKPTFYPYGVPNVDPPPIVAMPENAPPPGQPVVKPANRNGSSVVWTSARNWTSVQTEHPWNPKYPSGNNVWATLWMAPSFGVPCPPSDYFDARILDTLTIYQARP
jgi:hypothetical protein